jgi:hypothetical protein
MAEASVTRANERSDEVNVVSYDDSMRRDVIALLCEEYGGDAEARAEEFERFYDHPFQRDR